MYFEKSKMYLSSCNVLDERRLAIRDGTEPMFLASQAGGLLVASVLQVER